MFLTQKHPSTGITVDGNPELEISFEYAVRSNLYVFLEIVNVVEHSLERSYQAAFFSDDLR